MNAYVLILCRVTLLWTERLRLPSKWFGLYTQRLYVTGRHRTLEKIRHPGFSRRWIFTFWSSGCDAV